jgi:hypothetical protein
MRLRGGLTLSCRWQMVARVEVRGACGVLVPKKLSPIKFIFCYFDAQRCKALVFYFE